MPYSTLQYSALQRVQIPLQVPSLGQEHRALPEEPSLGRRPHRAYDGLRLADMNKWFHLVTAGELLNKVQIASKLILVNISVVKKTVIYSEYFLLL